ncbi:UNVERIFIED_CONTAM: Retrovirus-related Pol polyprotein from transposon RE2, partial [Sesamum latifolium]
YPGHHNEIWHGKPASYKYLRVWGSLAYVKKLVGDKLDSRSSLCRFIGYPKETAGYYFYDPAEQKIFVSRNAVFLEVGFPSDNRRDEVLIEESSGEPHHDNTNHLSLQFTLMVFQSSVGQLENLVYLRGTDSWLTSQLDNDPKMYGEAMSDIDSDKWLEAMKSEMDSMGSNQVWTLVDPPKGARPVGCKWVYKCRLGADGEVTAYKARLMAKGYTQRPGVDFDETYSPVAMAKSIRILLAIAAWYDYEIWQMDVKTTFLNSFVEEEIFMDQPEVSLLLEKNRKSVVSKGNIKAWLSTQFSKKDMGEASYILRRYHLLREMVSRGDCRMDRVSSAENTVDPLTKPMSQIAHTQHLDKMCLRSMGD